MEECALKPALLLVYLLALLLGSQEVDGETRRFALDAFNRTICGQLANSPMHPWHVVVRKQASFEPNASSPDGCGGFLIHRDLVLTAAHCVKNKTTVMLFAGLTSWPERTPDPSEVQMAGSKRICRAGPEFTSSANYSNNLAVIRLDTPFTYNQDVGPVCLQDFGLSEPRYRSQCQTQGWPGYWMDTNYYKATRRRARHRRVRKQHISERQEFTHWPVGLIECEQIDNELECDKSRADESCYQTYSNHPQWGQICMIGNSGTALTCLDSAQQDSTLHYAVGLLSRGLYRACLRGGVARAHYLDLFKDEELLVALLAECAPDYKLQ